MTAQKTIHKNFKNFQFDNLDFIRIKNLGLPKSK